MKGTRVFYGVRGSPLKGTRVFYGVRGLPAKGTRVFYGVRGFERNPCVLRCPGPTRERNPCVSRERNPCALQCPGLACERNRVPYSVELTGTCETSTSHFSVGASISALLSCPSISDAAVGSSSSLSRAPRGLRADPLPPTSDPLSSYFSGFLHSAQHATVVKTYCHLRNFTRIYRLFFLAMFWILGFG